jgi:hypothetical protein
MIISKKNILLLLFSIFLFICMTGCASNPPLPPNLNIVSPSPDVPPETAAFSGIWEGKWGAIQDTVIVIEEIDTQRAEVIISLGKAETGISPQNQYMYLTATVLPRTIIWSIGEKLNTDCPCSVVLSMDNGPNNLTAFWIFEKTKIKFRADLTRRKQ